MTRYILDASVAAKWLLPPGGEPLASEARQLLRGFPEVTADERLANALAARMPVRWLGAL